MNDVDDFFHEGLEHIDRMSRDEMYLEICEVLRKRSTCRRGQVGALIVRDRHIVAAGYNGAPPGAPHCVDVGCSIQARVIVEGDTVQIEDLGCQRAIHAEANAIAMAARHGQATVGTTMYCTYAPCLKCAQLMVSAGIVALEYYLPYRLTDGIDLLHDLGVHTRQHFGRL